MPFSLDQLDHRVRNTVRPEVLRDIIVSIFDEVEMRTTGVRNRTTGFEEADDRELRLSLYRTVNETVIRMH